MSLRHPVEGNESSFTDITKYIYLSLPETTLISVYQRLAMKSKIKASKIFTIGYHHWTYFVIEKPILLRISRFYYTFLFVKHILLHMSAVVWVVFLPRELHVRTMGAEESYIYMYIRRVVYIHIYIRRARQATEWRTRIECFKLQVIFYKRATNYRALLRKITYENKASYESTPHCKHVTR